MSYEPEADVLTWEVSNRPIAFAKEVGNVVIHFTDDETPVLIEFLDASDFLLRANRQLERRAYSSRHKPKVPAIV